MTDPTPDEERAHLLAVSAEDVQRFSADLGSDDVILVADTRDPLAAELAAWIYMPAGSWSGGEATALYNEAAAKVAGFTMEHDEAGRVPVVTAQARRDFIDRALRAVDLDSTANALPDHRVVVVGSGGVMLA